MESPTTEPTATAETATAATPRRRRQLIEIGWVLVGRLDPPDRQAVKGARRRLRDTLSRLFPAFEWRLPVVEREAPATRQRVEPVDLLETGLQERQAKRWDFALVVTGGDLRSVYEPFAFAAPARSLSVGVISTSRIDPRATDRTVSKEERVAIMTRRLDVLALHLLGHLAGLGHDEEGWSYLYDLDGVEDLDRMERFPDEVLEELRQDLADVADARLEERAAGRRSGRFGFYLRAAWQERDAILSAVRNIRPWQFPIRLGRLTTAALSAQLLLMVTAEVWDLGMSQRPEVVALLFLATLFATSGYLVVRQRLLLQRDVAHLTELTVVTNVSLVLAVLLGMLTTYVGLFGLTWTLAHTLFTERVITGWAASIDGGPTPYHYLVFAGFVACLGLLIGALGGSFEEQRYFRHVAYVDEET